MYRIAVVDSNIHWSFALKSLFQQSFEVTLFEQVPNLLQELFDYDLVIISHSNFSHEFNQKNISPCEIIFFIKKNVLNPPILVIASEPDEEDDWQAYPNNCPVADAFYNKKAALEELLQQTQKLLSSRKRNFYEQASELTQRFTPMPTMAVVDDDIHWCFTIERFLRKEFEVFTFPNVADFLKQSFDFDIVLVDYSIPTPHYEDHIESRDLVRYLKKLRYPPVVILVSGYVSKNDLALGKQICPEADSFFAKDAGLDELLKRVKELLNCQK